MTNKCTAIDDALMTSPIFVTGVPAVKKFNTSTACKYVKRGFIKADIQGKN